ncbi:glycoside hydrolase family 30 protein [Alteribacter natronophilus]|uniref:glycoside hydrolase family 30 protein n=1 Tax=Alteribacter natronophilus TaxID=2583810 RepID=UPI00110DEBBD|nr:glycoside hydrolase family 30 protein [Alteribacter natronophilus]TMW71277.1 glucosylceramidase [Alteribacter natronophilus]
MTKTIRIIESVKDKAMWQEKDPIVFTEKDRTGENSATINPEAEYQEWMGFGGAFTEAAAYTLSQVSPAHREEAIRAYFNEGSGLGYTLGRTHIHSCDFALENYTYVEEGDASLESFSIEREEKYVLPMIRDAVAEAGRELTLLSSPWSPPAWMKTNGEMNHGGKLKPEFRGVWANYYVKYIEAMEKAGIPVWGVSVQNEPAAKQVWDSCLYTAVEECDFIRDHLGPALEESGLGEKKIVIWDHNRDIIVERAETVLSDPEAAKYVWGTGNHWYVSEEFENLSIVHEKFPDKHLLFTEGCIEGGVKLGAWHTGERYARNIIGDMNNWLEGFIDWNLVLNEQGGPNHVGNYCDAPIIADTKTDELHYNSSYYAIGHFSRHILPGAKRIGLKSSADGLVMTAFKNTDGSVVLVVLNEQENDVPFSLSMEGHGAEAVSKARSIATYVMS